MPEESRICMQSGRTIVIGSIELRIARSTTERVTFMVRQLGTSRRAKARHCRVTDKVVLEIS